MTNKNNSQPATLPFGGSRRGLLGVKTIILALMSIFLFVNCTGKSKQPKGSESQQTEVVDTNKIYEAWEVDEPPVMP